MSTDRSVIICDLDGTLCDASHRVHLVQGKPKLWDAFYAGVKDDAVHDHILLLLRSMYFNYHYIVFVSGRPERCRKDTEDWLYDRCGFRPETYHLFMRKDKDHRPDYIVKEEILNAHINKDEVLFVLDDRQQVVDMWRRNGIHCLQVAKGDF